MEETQIYEYFTQQWPTVVTLVVCGRLMFKYFTNQVEKKDTHGVHTKLDKIADEIKSYKNGSK